MRKISLSKILPPMAALIVAVIFMATGVAFAQVAGGTLDPTTIPKYTDSLPIPKVMPKEGTIGNIDYYEIAVRQFKQQILPSSLPKTTVWGYGAADDSSTFSYPARTIETKVNKPVRVKWINDLKDSHGKYLPHLLPIDQTLHWANPPQDCIDKAMLGSRSDCRGKSQALYTGPVPIVTHLHGAHVQTDSDGYPEAWYLPNANNIPAGYAKKGSNFEQIPGVPFTQGAAVYQYPNTQRATTLWYHDHVLGMTRASVYTGLAGLYLIRDSSDPSGLPKDGFEVPLVIQDKSFNSNGSLFFPDNRAFFEGVAVEDLQIPFIPEITLTGGISDVSPIWNPEFFGNVMVVNGKSWPKADAEQRRYRVRILNGSDTRVLILKIVANPLAERPVASAVPFWQIGADGGFLPKPVKLDELLIGPAERVDAIVDFTNVPKGTNLYLINEGPDEPFGGGRAPADFAAADPGTTGQVMKLTVVRRTTTDTSTPPQLLSLPQRTKLGSASKTTRVSLNEAESDTVNVIFPDGKIVESRSANAVPFAPVEALLGIATVDANGVVTPTPLEWIDNISENPNVNATEIWEVYNFTEDAHPIHIHLVEFEVINRQQIAIDEATMTATLVPGSETGPEPGETGTKDTALMYPGTVTRFKAKFDIAGLFVWHCHILSHEDNEMMRPYCVGNIANCKK